MDPVDRQGFRRGCIRRIPTKIRMNWGAPENLVGNWKGSGAPDGLRDRMVPGPKPTETPPWTRCQDSGRPWNQGYQRASRHKVLSSPIRDTPLGRQILRSALPWPLPTKFPDVPIFITLLNN